jgi:hypothetical protein
MGSVRTQTTSWQEVGLLLSFFNQALRALRDGVHAVAEKNALEPNWLNYLTHLLMYDQIIIPRGKLWRRYGPLQIYIPPNHRPGRRLALRPSERNQHPRGLKVPGCHSLSA